MQFKTLIRAAATLTLLAPSALAVSLSYDESYDVGSTSLANVACSDGPNGLMTKGFTTFDSLPQFPYIGGADVVDGWNSPSCGSCWQLTYAGTGRNINLLVVDHTDAGFNVALAAMNDLTDNQAQQLGRIDVTATPVDASACGL